MIQTNIFISCNFLYDEKSYPNYYYLTFRSVQWVKNCINILFKHSNLQYSLYFLNNKVLYKFNYLLLFLYIYLHSRKIKRIFWRIYTLWLELL